MKIPSIREVVTLFTSQRNHNDFLKGVTNVGTTSAGVSITTDNSMTIAGVYSAVRVITDAISQLPTHVVREVGNNIEKDKSHALFPLVSRQPNDLMTNFVFWQIMFPNVLLWGNAYAIIDFDPRTMRPISLLPVHPSMVTVSIQNGILMYTFRLEGGTEFTLDQSNVLHYRGLGDQLMGKSVIDLAEDNLGLGKAAEGFGSTFFGNGTNMNGVLTTDSSLSDKARKNISDSISSSNGGLSKSNKLLLLEEGLKFQPTSIAPDSAQFLETRKFSIVDIARWFKLAPHKIADLERATFSNIEEQDLNFVKETILPWVIMIEQEDNRKLLREDEKNTLSIKKNLDGLLRGDIKTRYEAHKVGIQNGFITPNEARKKENMNPIDGLDTTWMQLNTAPVVDGTNQQAKEEEVKETIKPKEDEEN
jgi:HK97 family phage portal protein